MCLTNAGDDDLLSTAYRGFIRPDMRKMVLSSFCHAQNFFFSNTKIDLQIYLTKTKIEIDTDLRR